MLASGGHLLLAFSADDELDGPGSSHSDDQAVSRGNPNGDGPSISESRSKVEGDGHHSKVLLTSGTRDRPGLR